MEFIVLQGLLPIKCMKIPHSICLGCTREVQVETDSNMATESSNWKRWGKEKLA